MKKQRYLIHTHMATMQQHRNLSKYRHTDVTWACRKRRLKQQIFERLNYHHFIKYLFLHDVESGEAAAIVKESI